MKERIVFICICFGAIGFARIFGFSNDAGLFGAILSGGIFIIGCVEDTL